MLDESVKSHHSCTGGNPGYRKGIGKTGFPVSRE
jgi:hypothetical protein